MHNGRRDLAQPLREEHAATQKRACHHTQEDCQQEEWEKEKTSRETSYHAQRPGVKTEKKEP